MNKIPPERADFMSSHQIEIINSKLVFTAIEQKSDHAKISCVPKIYLKKNQSYDR